VLTGEVREMLSASKDRGWVLEPEAKRLFARLGLDVPRFIWTTRLEEALRFAREIGYPVVAKVVSPEILHKSERKGVAAGIQEEGELIAAVDRFRKMEGFAGVLVEEMVQGLELIVGSKDDYQFGPVILLGIGGTGVEIYRDVTLRMAPLNPKDIENMVRCLKARRLLEGYRGTEPISLSKLSGLLSVFSGLVMDLEGSYESIDLNPVICSSNRCVIADARIILPKSRMIE